MSQLKHFKAFCIQRVMRMELWLFKKLHPQKPTLKSLKLLLEIVRPELTNDLVLFKDEMTLRTPTPDIVTFAAVMRQVSMALSRHERIEKIFYSFNSDKRLSSEFLLDFNGCYTDIAHVLGVLRGDLQVILAFYHDSTQKADVDIVNRRYIQKNLTEIQDAVFDMLDFFSSAPLRK